MAFYILKIFVQEKISTIKSLTKICYWFKIPEKNAQTEHRIVQRI